MDQVQTFLNDPLVSPLYGLLVISVIDMLLGVYRSIQEHVFDWSKLPQILDSTVLKAVLPLAALGVASMFVTEPAAKAGLQAAYVAGAAAALAGALTALIRKVTGNYTPTTKAMDKNLKARPAVFPSTETSV